MKHDGKNILISLIKNIGVRFRAYRLMIHRRSSYLNSTGWMESLKRGYPCRQDGTELPWMNYAMIRFLEQRLNKNMTFFEYGSGYSTLFYSRLAGSITSVEYDRNWYEKIRKKIPDNATLIFRDKDIDGAYCRSICENPEAVYDVIIIDGRDRVNCMKQSIAKLSQGGVIILDDSQRERYIEGIQYLKKSGFLTLDFEGIKPCGSNIDRATVFYRRENCLSI